MHMLLLIPLMALVGAGLYVTFVGIPESVRGLYRMHIYAPPAAFFIVAASAVLIVAPFQGLTPASAVNVGISIALSSVFAAIGLTSILRNGRAALLR